MSIHINLASENALIIQFGTSINPQVLAQVSAASTAISAKWPLIVQDVIPSYASLVVIFDPNKSHYHRFKKQIYQLLTSLDQYANVSTKCQFIELPVYYSRESGADMGRLMVEKNLSQDDIIGLHSRQSYTVYAIGFAPGFAYLGEVAKQLASPRLSSPRALVPKGSVAIADRQTAVYPSASPGGWNIIGCCPLELSLANNTSTPIFAVGDTVKFTPISAKTFRQLGGSL